MTKYAILLVAFSLLIGARAWAQAEPDKTQTKKDKQETVKTGDKPTEVIKVVPAARSKHAKPEKVSSAKPRTAKPRATRPARNVRPSSRPLRPGKGRN